jgi:hypothetical protein
MFVATLVMEVSAPAATKDHGLAARTEPHVKPSHSAMNNALIFARAGRRLVVRHCRVGDGALLFVLGDDRESRSYSFNELAGLQQFRRRLEDFLTETGWSLFQLGETVSDESRRPHKRAGGGWNLDLGREC